MDNIEEKPADAVSVQQPAVTETSSTPVTPSTETLFASDSPPPSPPTKSRSKRWMMIALVLVFVAAGLYLLLAKKTEPAKTVATIKNTKTLASAKPQFFQGDSVSGYVKYEPTKFKEVSSIGIPGVTLQGSDTNVVIVSANVVSYGGSGLYMYDLKTNKSYKLTDGGGDPRIMSDHFLLYGFDETVNGKHMLGGKLLDLNTGQVQTVFSGAPQDVPGNVCCSVSPDGFKAAFPQKDKITVWDIRTATSKDYPATLNPIGEGFTNTAANPYNVEGSYATPQWSDNDSLIYADKPATKTVMVGNSATKPAVDTNLYMLNLSTGQSSELATGNSGIYTIYARGGSNFVDEVTVDTNSNQFSKLMLDKSNKPEVIAYNPDGFLLLSQKGDKLYMFPTLYSTGSYTTVDTNTKTTTSFNPLPSDITSVSQIIPKGWVGEDRIVLQILDTHTAVNHEYIGIYNTSTDKVEQYLKIK